MPVEFGIWRIDEGVIPVPSSAIENETKLEDILEEDLSILGLDVLLLVGRQVITALGKRIDLLAMDVNGDLYAIELKRGRTPREVVAQTIDYGYWLRDLDSEGLVEVFDKYNTGESFDGAFRDRFDQDPPDEINENHHLIVVASELDASTERIVDYISDYGVPINVVFFQHFHDGDREYLARSWLSDPEEVEARAGKSRQSGARKPRPPWNKQDFYVAFGESDDPNHDRRRWEDAVKYGFISAGGGLWFSRTLEQLFPGARVFVYIPKTGYVGVGTVTETSKWKWMERSCQFWRRPWSPNSWGRVLTTRRRVSIWFVSSGSRRFHGTMRYERRACSPTRTAPRNFGTSSRLSV